MVHATDQSQLLARDRFRHDNEGRKGRKDIVIRDDLPDDVGMGFELSFGNVTWHCCTFPHLLYDSIALPRIRDRTGAAAFT